MDSVYLFQEDGMVWCAFSASRPELIGRGMTPLDAVYDLVCKENELVEMQAAQTSVIDDEEFLATMAFDLQRASDPNFMIN